MSSTVAPDVERGESGRNTPSYMALLVSRIHGVAGFPLLVTPCQQQVYQRGRLRALASALASMSAFMVIPFILSLLSASWSKFQQLYLCLTSVLCAIASATINRYVGRSCNLSKRCFNALIAILTLFALMIHFLGIELFCGFEPVAFVTSHRNNSCSDCSSATIKRIISCERTGRTIAIWLGGALFVVISTVPSMPFGTAALIGMSVNVMSKLPAEALDILAFVSWGSALNIVVIIISDIRTRNDVISFAALKQNGRKQLFELQVRDHMIKESRAEAEEARKQAENARKRAKNRQKDIKRNKLALNAANSKLKQSEEERARAQQIVDAVLCKGGRFDIEMRLFLIKYADLVFSKADDAIGEGAFGTVYKGELYGQTVAVKTMRVGKISEDILTEFQDEVTVMAPLRHKNLVGLVGACWKDGPEKLALVMEYAGRGTFTAALDNANFSWKHPYLQVMNGIANCLVYLHNLDPAIMHRDIKPDNVLLDVALHAKLADFGSARRWRSETDERGASTMTTRGTPLYMAPEMLRHEAYNESVDVFAVGMLLFTALVDDGAEYLVKSTFEVMRGGVREFLAKRANAHQRPEIPGHIEKGHQELCALIRKMWDEDAAERPDALVVLNALESERDRFLQLSPSSRRTSYVITARRPQRSSST